MTQAQTKTTGPAPAFYMELTVSFAGFGGHPDRSEKMIRARNSSGVSMYATELSHPDERYTTRKIYYPEGIERSTLDVYKSVATVSLPGNKAGIAQTDVRACMAPGEKLEGQVMLSGIRMYRVVEEDARKVSSRTIWPEGGCVEAESVHHWRDESGKLGGTTTTKLNILRLENPPPDLFEVGADYVEESQTEGMIREYAGKKERIPNNLVETGLEMKRYRRYGPGPGGQAEQFVKKHHMKLPDPNSKAMKISLQ